MKFLYLGCLLVLLGCVHRQPYLPPNDILANAHVGGSVVAIGPASRLLASGGWEGRIRLWELPGGKARGGWQAHQGEVTAIVFAARGQGLLSSGHDGRLVLWDRSGTRLLVQSTNSPIRDMVSDAASGRVITAHNDGVLRFWRVSDLRPWREIHISSRPLRALAWHSDTRLLAVSGEDGRVVLVSADGVLVSLPLPPTVARTLVFSADGGELYGAGWFKLFRWEIAARRLTVLPTEHRGVINALFLQPNGSLASISRQTDSAVLSIDPGNGKTLKRMQAHQLCGADIAASRDGRFLATTSDDASVRIWDMRHPLSLR